MKKSIFLFLLVLGSMLTLAKMPVNVSWQNLGNRFNAEKKPEFVSRLVITGDVKSLDKLAFNKFDCRMKSLDDRDTVIRVIPGYFYISSPRFATAGDSLVIDIVTSGAVTSCSYGIVDAHGIDANGKPFPVNFHQETLTSFPEQYIYNGKDRMASADSVYRFNERMNTEPVVLPYAVIPSFKNVSVTNKGYFTDKGKVTTKQIRHANPEYFRINVKPDKAVIEGASPEAIRYGKRMLKRLLVLNDDKLPTAIVDGYPDNEYRGMMIDIARNYHPLSNLLHLLDAMADYGFNRLQFHFTDDEAWRLEIPDLPELTTYASKRGFTTDESEFLAQIYFGDGNPESTKGTANGYLTKNDFIRFLQHADSLGITIIPEIETPGHARAAVKAMEAYYRRTGDSSFRLREDGDTSTYSSAQDFHDNVMNPALPGPYKFMEKVFEALQQMYSEAGLKLETIHIGGDEVPGGAWGGSPAAIAFMKEHGMKDEGELHAWWVKNMVDNLAKRGIKTAGWQEIALGKDSTFAKSIAPNIAYINIWQPWVDKNGVLPAEKAQRFGIPVLNSTCTGYYLDMAYSGHPDEPGFSWAGVTDEFRTLNTYPVTHTPKTGHGKVVGVQGQLWAETINSPQRRERYLFPKMLGLAERAWNADTTFTDPYFNRTVEKELKRLVDNGYSIHLRQPGIKIQNNQVFMNSPYTIAEIHYTLDGSEPTLDSPLYRTPFTLSKNVKSIRAKLFYRGAESVATTLKP